MGYQSFSTYDNNYSEKGLELLEIWDVKDDKKLKAWNGGTGHVQIRGVRCGKSGCTKCPHIFYAYLKCGNSSKYLGRCDSAGNPYHGKKRQQNLFSGVVKKKRQHHNKNSR